MNIPAEKYSKIGSWQRGFPSSVHTGFGIIVLLVVILLLSVTSKPVLASNLSCDNRYLTLVNPVRSRNLWSDQSLKPIQDQYSLINDHHFAATWLLQYDVFKDHDLLATIQGFNPQQEKGIFLEVSADLAKDARVLYPQQTPWFKPNAIFLSGYSQSERRKLIDTIFGDFRSKFGFYPKSVGAWWIDSYSLQYMQQKYGIVSAMIVADQLSTDNYGVWGQWWGVPFFPSKANVLEPANSIGNKLPVTVIQWAQRDPERSYGDSKLFSNYSIQANDYSTQGLTTDYFKEITSVYLDCTHPIGQITVGLETGQESVPFITEYGRQLNYLGTVSSLKSVSMSDFASQFSLVYPQFPKNEKLSYMKSEWNFTTSGRANTFLGDSILYNQNLAFADYFIPDHREFLDRKLPLNNQTTLYFPWWVLTGVIGVIFFKKKKMILVGVTGILLAISSYGLIFHSFYQYGWKVYFGPVVYWLPLVQIGLVIIGFLVAYGWWKLTKGDRVGMYLPVLVFGLDSIIESIRYTKLDSTTYFGFLTDPYHFFGISFGKNFQLINQVFSAQIASALLKFDFQRIWSNTLNWLVIYPVIHLLIAIILFFIIKKLPVKARWGVIGILGVFWMLFLLNLLGKDPTFVQPTTQMGLLGLIQ